MMKNKPKKNGQVLIIFAIALVVLLGFTALAVDGTIVYNERRTDQSTADSAAMAGAGAAAQYLKTKTGFTCTTTSGSLADLSSQAAIAAAQATATTLGTTLDTNLTASNGVVTTCGTINGTPYLDVHVMVSTSVNTYFLKSISKQPTKTTVDAIARVLVNTSFASGDALVALGTDCSNSATQTNPGGIYVSGSAKVIGSGGGIFSNACLDSTNSSATITDSTGGITDMSVGPHNNQWISPTPTVTTTAMTIPPIPVDPPPSAPICDATSKGAANPSGSGGRLVPGTYDSFSWGSNGGGDLTLANTDGTPGTYCFKGSFSTGGGSAKIIMNGDTIYFSGSGGLTVSGNIATQLNNSFVYITNGDYHPAQVTWTANNSKLFILKGNYQQTGSVNVTMNNSSIYLANGNFTDTNGYLTAHNFTVIIRQGDYSLVNGAYGVDIAAPNCSDSSCGVGPSIPGVLVWMDPAYSHNFTIGNGNGAHTINGTVYAPTAIASLTGGTYTNVLKTQIIVQQMTLGGSGTINMDAGSGILYQPAGTLTIQLLK
jgi:hypothetical protein